MSITPASLAPAVLKNWIENESPDVVLSPLNTVKSLLEKSGFRIPQDIAFVTLNWTESVRHLSGVSLNPHQVGTVAVDLFSAQSATNQFGIPPSRITVQVEPFWVDGGTLEADG